MTWDNTHTWTAAETVTATMMQTYIKGNFAAIGDAWTAYGSGSSWTGSGTNPAIGNGTWAGFYVQAGKLTLFRVVITMGSTTTYGSGTYSIALPFTAATVGRLLITGGARDNSASDDFPIFGIIASAATTASLRTLPTTAGNALANMTPTVPFTLANLDSITLDGVYEAA